MNLPNMDTERSESSLSPSGQNSIHLLSKETLRNSGLEQALLTLGVPLPSIPIETLIITVQRTVVGASLTATYSGECQVQDRLAFYLGDRPGEPYIGKHFKKPSGSPARTD